MNRIILGGDERDFLVYRDGSGGTVEVFDIAVGSERRRGKGRRLLEMLFERLASETRVFAITRSDNEVAIRFYEATCFDVCGVLRRFYGCRRGTDAVMFVRKASGPV
jgi:ribosomal protein S18 acetylase RimI-like enzyme